MRTKKNVAILKKIQTKKMISKGKYNSNVEINEEDEENLYNKTNIY